MPASFVVPTLPPSKRPRRQEPEEEALADGGVEAEDFVPYVPLAKRREERTKLYASSASGLKEKQQLQDAAELEREREQEEVEKREALRKKRTLLDGAAEVKKRKAEEDARKSAEQLKQEEEEKFLKELAGQQRKLVSDAELAQGVEYKESLPARWAKRDASSVGHPRSLTSMILFLSSAGPRQGISATRPRRRTTKRASSITSSLRATTCLHRHPSSECAHSRVASLPSSFDTSLARSFPRT